MKSIYKNYDFTQKEIEFIFDELGNMLIPDIEDILLDMWNRHYIEFFNINDDLVLHIRIKHEQTLGLNYYIKW